MGNYDSAPSNTATADPDVPNAGSILSPSNLFRQHQLLGSRSSALWQLIQSALSWHLDTESSARKLLPYPPSAHVKQKYRRAPGRRPAVLPQRACFSIFKVALWGEIGFKPT